MNPSQASRSTASVVKSRSTRPRRSDVEAQRVRLGGRTVEALAKLGSFELDLTTGAFDPSHGACAIFGLTPLSPLAVNQALGFFGSRARARIRSWLRTATLSGQACQLILPFRSSAGTAGWLHMVGQVDRATDAPRLVAVIRDITEEREREAALRRQVGQDTLTGLPDRRAFLARIDEAVATSMGRGAFALCILDIDGLKTVNDRYGYEIGDLYLREVALRLSRLVGRPEDVARLDGDEFAIVLPGLADGFDAESWATSLLDALRAPFRVGEGTLATSISAGVVLCGGSQAKADAAVTQAQVALGQAKRNGRDQACLFAPRLQRRVDERRRLLADVSLGLAQNQFEVVYQPIVDLRSRIIRGWEALIRWNHPEHGLLSPASFMPALADPTTSVVIDDLVLATSLRHMREWLDAGAPVTCAGVNMSESQLKRADLIPRIMSLLAQYDLTPDRLKIEVLETAFLGADPTDVADTIETLARLGVVSALDDFGTGYASLIHLKQFRVERVKIDRSFVANLGSSRFDQAIVKGIINLGRDLGIRITAEGVETVEQLRMLRGFGCDCGQGYLFARPMAAGQVPDFLRRWHSGLADQLLSESDAFERAPVPVS